MHSLTVSVYKEYTCTAKGTFLVLSFVKYFHREQIPNLSRDIGVGTYIYRKVYLEYKNQKKAYITSWLFPNQWTRDVNRSKLLWQRNPAESALQLLKN